jgi:hypothetical protein
VKTITVREAAKALNLTKRAVMYRLENGKLRGIRVKNDFGMDEWRIYPTKEILAGLQRALAANPTVEPAPADDAIYDAEEVNEEDFVGEEEISWGEKEKDTIKKIAEEFMRPLLDKIDAQTRELAFRERELEELKVKLLPDLETKAEAERKAAELKELEAEALRKQIAALQSQHDEVETARQRSTELEEVVRQLESQKEADMAAMRQQIEELTQRLQKPAEPWWKKWFTSPAP